MKSPARTRLRDTTAKGWDCRVENDLVDRPSVAAVGPAVESAAIKSEKSAKAFLRALILADASAQLFDARQSAGLTQEELAIRLDTKQSAVSRIEHDALGRMSLHSFVDWAFACGFAPRTLELHRVHSFVRLARTAARSRSSDQWFEAGAPATLFAAVGNGGAFCALIPTNAGRIMDLMRPVSRSHWSPSVRGSIQEVSSTNAGPVATAFRKAPRTTPSGTFAEGDHDHVVEGVSYAERR